MRRARKKRTLPSPPDFRRGRGRKKAAPVCSPLVKLRERPRRRGYHEEEDDDDKRSARRAEIGRYARRCSRKKERLFRGRGNKSARRFCEYFRVCEADRPNGKHERATKRHGVRAKQGLIARSIDICVRATRPARTGATRERSFCLRLLRGTSARFPRRPHTKKATVICSLCAYR